LNTVEDLCLTELSRPLYKFNCMRLQYYMLTLDWMRLKVLWKWCSTCLFILS